MRKDRIHKQYSLRTREAKVRNVIRDKCLLKSWYLTFQPKHFPSLPLVEFLIPKGTGFKRPVAAKHFRAELPSFCCVSTRLDQSSNSLNTQWHQCDVTRFQCKFFVVRLFSKKLLLQIEQTYIYTVRAAVTKRRSYWWVKIDLWIFISVYSEV